MFGLVSAVQKVLRVPLCHHRLNATFCKIYLLLVVNWVVTLKTREVRILKGLVRETNANGGVRKLSSNK